MKIAFLILAHSKPHQLAALVEAIGPLGRCFIHVDAAVNLQDFLTVLPASESVVYVSSRFNIRWAGFGMVSATLSLARMACESDVYDYLVLLSGQDYPIKSNAFILQALEAGGELITARTMPHLGHPLSRLDCYFFAPKDRDAVLPRAWNALMVKAPVRSWRTGVMAGMVPCSGSQWWALTADSIKYILQFVDDHPDFVSFFHRTRYPDEMFFQIIIAASPFAAEIKSTSTFAEWHRPVPPWPATLHPHDLDLLRSRPELFARKFDLDADPGIFDLIDRELRS